MTVEAPVMLTRADEAAAAETRPVPDRDGALLMTRTGFTFHVRPATPADEGSLADFFSAITPEDMRFRFLSALPRIDRDRLHMMTHVDHDRTESFLAFDLDGRTIIATAMLAADPAMEKAEVAVSVRSDCQDRGIGWAMLKHLARYAELRDIGTLFAVESQANSKGIELEREMGFTARPCPGDATLVLLEAKLAGGK